LAASPTSSIAGPSKAEQAARARQAAIDALLRRRSAALDAHDRTAFRATLDPRNRAFRDRQMRMFANLADVPTAGWLYRMSGLARTVPAARRRHYGAAVFAPATLVEQFRLAGFDRSPSRQVQYPTFVERAGRWYLTSLSDFRAEGHVSATQLWDYAKVRLVRRPDVLILGPSSMLATMQSVAAETSAAIPRVTAVWGRHWARRAVVQVPASEAEMAAITGDRQSLARIVALTSAEISTANGRPAPVGGRITLNPVNWRKLGPLGTGAALAHELTHLATRSVTGVQTPKWLSEGFADYVGYRTVPLPPTVIAAQLTAEVQAGRLPHGLPGNGAFNGNNLRLQAAYDEAWMSCRYIAARYGQARLVRFYRAVGTSRRPGRQAVRIGLRTFLHSTPRAFVADWRSYLAAEL
jgi:hypothetical protein